MDLAVAGPLGVLIWIIVIIILVGIALAVGNRAR